MNHFENLRTFITVAEVGSLTMTAEKLYIAKSAISRRLSELENHLGVQLFHRSTRSLSLTDEGQQFYERSRAILNDLDEAEQQVKSARLELQGRFRLAAPLSFGLLHLTPLLNTFMVEHPNIEFDIDFNDREVDIINEGFDLVLRIGQLLDSNLMSRKLASINVQMCASPAYLEQYGEPQTVDDLHQHDLLRYSLVPVSKMLTCTDAKGAKHTAKMSVSLTSNNGEHLANAAISGKGIAVLPTFITYQALREGQLKSILTNYSWSRHLELHAIYPQTRHLSKRVRTLIDFLHEQFSDQPYWDVLDDICIKEALIKS